MSQLSVSQYQVSASLNNSTSKQKYSFSKQKRFGNDKQIYCSNFYNVPNVKDKRSTSFGYGSKIDLSKQSMQSPPPGCYQIKSEFEIQKDKHKGISFGLSREQVKGTQLFRNSDAPAPGKYDWKTSTISDIKYTLRSKFALPDEKYTNKFSPAPGAYETQKIQAMNGTGRYNVASFKSAGVAVINPLGMKPKEYNNFPGPQKYNPVGTFSAKGDYFVAKYRSSGARSFSHAQRATFDQGNKNPGVGSYQVPCEFGFTQQMLKK